jgi:soluble epoxide hydrolase / lipid-phosphate phosphatase
MSSTTITEHVAKSAGHTNFYLAAGPTDGPLMIFVHGWPELSISWRHQLPCFASLGFRCIAPDMRGYGRSSVYDTHAAYAQEPIVGDMLELLTSLGREKAIWVGHDWGSPVVWNLASHHPERCVAVANLCVPYWTLERGLDSVLPLVNREIYPEKDYPAGQWEYMRFYEENFDAARRAFEVDPYNTAKLLFRKGNPAGFGKPSFTATVRKAGGWFGGGGAPDLPRDGDVVSEEDLAAYAAALTRNGFFGPDSYYMNHGANAAYAAKAVNGGRLDMPALFLAAQYDYTCECITSRLAEPMREHCRDLAEKTILSGHWMAQEKPVEVNGALAEWLATRVPGGWPK